MMRGAIRRMERERIDERFDARLPFAWIGGIAAPSEPPHGRWLSRARGGAALSGTAPVMVWLGNGSEDALSFALECASAGARVYALVGPGWGNGGKVDLLSQGHRVLVRRIPEVPVTGIATVDGARLWIGGGFVLHLESSQAEALRKHFLRMFWHDASEEALSEAGQTVWRPAWERPFDVPIVSASASIRWEPPAARLAGPSVDSVMHVSAGLPPERTPRRLWIPAGPHNHDRLALLVQSGAEVTWSDRGLPDMQVSEGGGEILLPGASGRMRVLLTAAQALEVGRLLSETPVWRFGTNVRLGDASHRSARFWLPGEPAARGLDDEQTVEMHEVLAASLHDVSSTVPSSFPAAQPLALTVRYCWSVRPPLVPAEAAEDLLLAGWRTLDSDWASRVGTVRETLSALESEREQIGRAFSRLVGAMLGFQHEHADLLSEVGELSKRLPSSSGPEDALALLTLLSSNEEKTRKLQSDMVEAKRKAREEEEREKQEAAWRSRVEAARRDLPDRLAALSTAESRRAGIAEELRSIEESLKSADKEAKKDLTANERKLSDDLQRVNKEVTRLRGEVTALEQQSAESFEFRLPAAPVGGTKQSARRFVPVTLKASPAVGIPNEALPEVGLLRSHKGRRYLVIQSWEELAAGEQTAARLAARLVAPENV